MEKTFTEEWWAKFEKSFRKSGGNMRDLPDQTKIATTLYVAGCDAITSGIFCAFAIRKQKLAEDNYNRIDDYERAVGVGC
jgi:hypothetical protein